MSPETTDLVAALLALKRQIPGVCLAMTQGQLSAEKQGEFGEFLIQLGHLMQEQAPPQVIDGEAEQATPPELVCGRSTQPPQLEMSSNQDQPRL